MLPRKAAASAIAPICPFGISIGNHITVIPSVPGLAALEIDPQAAAQAYCDLIVDPVRGVLPETVVKGIEEQLSGACSGFLEEGKGDMRPVSARWLAWKSSASNTKRQSMRWPIRPVPGWF